MHLNPVCVPLFLQILYPRFNLYFPISTLYLLPIPGVSKRKAPTPEFTWLKPYLNNSASSSGSSKPPASGDHNSQQIFTIEGGSPCLVADLIGISPVGADGGSQTVNSDGSEGGDSIVETGQDVVVDRASPSHKGGPGSSLAAGDEADLLRVKDITLDNFALNQSTFYVSYI
jgi:hypothetical protein